MRKFWKPYEPLIQGIVALLDPFVEVAVHDIKKGKIVALYHCISQRQVGDASPLKELNIPIDAFPDVFTPYIKKNWDGRPLKCTSITLRNDQGQPIGLICINIDVSHFHHAEQLIQRFLKPQKMGENPIQMYGNSSEEQAITLIDTYLKKHHLQHDRLNRNQKKDLIQHLYHKGLFNFKNVVPFLANHLNLSRASIYNYIKEIGE
ncbi:MAG: PAS domain-containing protein [Chlamydiia bacterium]|nr:PAS domain-containing protein [Chlamydiia bacterium]